MPITLVTTIGGATSDSFVSVADADTYFSRRPNATAWTDLTDDDDKARLLLWAMRSLSGLDWIGGRYSETQALDWPRISVRPTERFWPNMHDGGYGYGYHEGGLYDQTGRFWTVEEIPTGVLNAQCEFALAIQQNAALSTPEKYKRRIITDANGTLEWNLGSQSAALNSLAMRELRGLLFTSAGVLATARG